MEMTRLGLKEVGMRWRTVIVMALSVSLSLMAYLLLNAYRTGLETRYENVQKDFLLVQETGSMGEFYGSRLPASLADELARLGASRVIAEIHTITGTTPDNAILVRGVQLDGYAGVEEYQVVEGRPLQAGDAARLAMIGARLAQQLNAFPGDVIQIRGRDFNVVGVFTNGTYADYEAWISLEDAQALLGWGRDVSVYVIPAGEQIKVGDSLPGGVSIVQKGESGQSLVDEWRPFFNLMNMIAATLGIAVTVALANILWRLAWLRRRELAILQSIGFGRLALAGYLFVQGAGITALGFGLGVLEALGIGAAMQLKTAGISIQAVFDLKVMALSLLFAVLIAMAGSGIPAWWFSRQNLVMLMRVEG